MQRSTRVCLNIIFISKEVLVTNVVIPALPKLVSGDAGGSTTSLAEEFELILEEFNTHKTYCL